jgi:hypothetical protein
MVPLKK